MRTFWGHVAEEGTRVIVGVLFGLGIVVQMTGAMPWESRPDVVWARVTPVAIVVAGAAWWWTRAAWRNRGAS